MDPLHPTLLAPGSSLASCGSPPGSQTMLVSVPLSESIPGALESQEDGAFTRWKTREGQEMYPHCPPPDSVSVFLLFLPTSVLYTPLASPCLPPSIPVSGSGPLGVS